MALTLRSSKTSPLTHSEMDANLSGLADLSLTSFLQSGAGAVTRTAQNKMRDVFNVKDFGALGDGLNDDTAEIQAAIDALEAIGGGTLFFPYGTYLITATLTVNKGVRLVGEGQINDTTSSSGVVGGTTIQWNSASNLDMITIKSATANQYLRGAGVIGIIGHGGSAAKSFIRASSIMNCKFDGVSQAVTEGGLILDDGNGVLCGLNQIPHWEHIYGSVAAVEGAHGVVLNGDVSDIGVTHNWIGSITGLVKNGDLLFMKDCDGNVIQHIQTSIAVGGTGHGVSFRNGTLNHARNNLIQWMLGDVLAESSTHGNNILHLHSGDTEVQIDAGGHLHYNTIDATNAEQWQTHRFVMSDQLLLNPGDFSPEEQYLAAVTYDPANLVDGAGVETDVTVTGALLGDFAEASFSLDTQGINLDAQVTASNIVTVRFQNETGGAIDLGSGTLRVRVDAHPTRVAIRGAAGDLWDSISFDQDFDVQVKASVHAPYHWNDGNITGVKLTFCMNAANTTDAARVRIRAITVTPLSSLSTPEVDESVDITVDDNALRVQEYTHTFATPLAFVRGQYIGLRIGRMGNHANDTAAGTLHLIGVNLLYAGEGPDSAGSGPFDIPPVGV